ncbi:MAG: 3-phosphoshikimate 1-carboxyvinyltransferase [Phycisphaerae bacterium]|jgi:3-phosphoshikimate 1-carboxyvinyltransferase
MRTVEKIKNRNTIVEAPPSKAHTLRALFIGSLAEGQTVIEKPLLGQDQLNVINCLKGLGTSIEKQSDKIIIEGKAGKFTPVSKELNVGESGVGMNFLSSAACLSDKPVVLTGSARIQERPIGEVIEGLKQLGAKIEFVKKDGFPPVRILGGGIEGGTAKMHGQKTSQYFSSVCISTPYARKDVCIECVDEMTERPYLDISLQMMSEFGVDAKNNNYKLIEIPRGKYTGRTIRIEGDYSSASFFLLAAAITQSRITVTNLRTDTKQGDKAFIDLMEQMGCKINREVDKIAVEGNKLKSIERDMSDIPDLVPPAAIACAFADGTSRLTNIGHLRHKECDRLAVMAEGLQKMGVNARCDETSLIIEGNRDAHGAIIDPHNDHRIAMSFAAAGLVTGGQQIENPGCVAKSFPDFWERFEIFYK